MTDISRPIMRIIETAAKQHGIRVPELLSKRRHRLVSAARHEAIKAVKQARPKYSAYRIGEIFGRHHTTILWVLGRIEKRRKRAEKQDQGVSP